MLHKKMWIERVNAKILGHSMYIGKHFGPLCVSTSGQRKFLAPILKS